MAEKDIDETITGAENVSPDLEALRATVTKLAKLDRLEYDQRRRVEADRLGVRVSVLDSAVKRERRKKNNGTAPPGDEEPRPPEFTDEALALQFAQDHADDLRYVAPWSKWCLWGSGDWRADETLQAFDFARAVSRDAASRCPNERVAAVVASAKTVAAVERLAKADRRLAATVTQWDPDDFLLNTSGETDDR